MLDAIGHVGYISIFIGLVLLNYKNKYGWMARLLGEALWIGIGFGLGMTSIWIWGIIFVCVDINGWRKWNSEKTD
jgi:hypothetical protein